MGYVLDREGNLIDEDTNQPVVDPPPPPPAATPDWYVPAGAPEGFRAYPDTEQGAEYYNEQQKKFEAGDTLSRYEAALKAAAEAKGIKYDPSDLAGIQRNAGYDAAHHGSKAQWEWEVEQGYRRALENYDQRASNNPGGDGGSSSGAGGRGGSGYTGPFAGPSFASGWMPTYTAPVFAPPPALDIPSWNEPAPFSYADFQRPTLEQARNEPGFAFAMEQGTNALANSAATKGLLRTGGTAKELIGFGQKLGEQNYNNVFNRDLGVYATNRDNASDIYTKNYSASKDAYKYGVDEIKGEYDSAYTTSKDVWDSATRGAEAEYLPKRLEAEANFKAAIDQWLEKMRIAGLIEQDSD